jgi:hypothetical protein
MEAHVMPFALIVALVFHVLSAVFWAGSTFTLSRIGAEGALRLFRPQMGAALIAVLSGAYLWSQLHRGFGVAEKVLLAGVLCAFAAAGVQGALIGPLLRKAARTAPLLSRALTAQRIAAALLAVTLICMVLARYI